jgi:ATP-binding cassette subfamily A (ABC1) protein 3
MYSSQLKLLLWKHFLLQKRSLFSLMLKLSVPALFAIVFMPIRTVIKTGSNPNDTTYYSFDLDSFDPSLPLYKNSSFGYFPNSSQLINSIMSRAASALELDFAGISLII